MKSIDADAITALANGSALVTGAVKFATSPAAAFMWGGYGDLAIGGDTYTGIGDFGTVAPLSFETGGMESGIQLSLNGIPAEINGLVMAENLRGVSVVIRRLIFDSTGTDLLDSSVFFRGRIDRVEMKERIGGSASVVLDVEGSARGLNRSGARIANLYDQKQISATDTSFERMATAPTATLYWMGKPPERASNTVNGGALSNPFGRFMDGKREPSPLKSIFKGLG